ncbi:MAG: hypothetical protein LBU76_03325 [Azoarcus sp.]|nr:hypothetical protein [Azoarcus sp.]
MSILSDLDTQNTRLRTGNFFGGSRAFPVWLRWLPFALLFLAGVAWLYSTTMSGSTEADSSDADTSLPNVGSAPASASTAVRTEPPSFSDNGRSATILTSENDTVGASHPPLSVPPPAAGIPGASRQLSSGAPAPEGIAATRTPAAQAPLARRSAKNSAPAARRTKTAHASAQPPALSDGVHGNAKERDTDIISVMIR